MSRDPMRLCGGCRPRRRGRQAERWSSRCRRRSAVSPRAGGLGERAARREAAAGQRLAQVGRAAADRHQLQRVRQQVGEGVAQAHRVGMARPRQHLAHRAALDHLAGIHHHDLVAEIGHDADVVRHQHHRELQPLLQLAQHVEDLALDDDVERRHRLVGQQQAGLQRQRHGDRGALAHAAGELVRIVGQPAFAEAHQVEQLGRAGAGGGARDAAALGQHLDELRADGIDRIERAHGALRHVGDVAPQQRPRVGSRRSAWPLKTMRPPARRPFSASTPMMARTAVVLPQPDLPTRPTIAALGHGEATRRRPRAPRRRACCSGSAGPSTSRIIARHRRAASA